MVALKVLTLCFILQEAYTSVVNLEFFYKEKYTDAMPVDAQLATGKCTSLPQWSWNKVESIKNNDCIMLFSHSNCQGRSYELPPGKGESFPDFKRDVASFRHCHPHEIGRSNNWVDNDKDPIKHEFQPKKILFYGNREYNGLLWDTLITPNCVSLPYSATGGVSSVKTAECVVLYSKKHCTGYSFVVESDDTWLRYFNDQTASFRPCTKQSILGEPRLSIEVIQFKFFEFDENAKSKKPTEYIKKSSFINNGTATIKHGFEAMFEYKEKTTTEFAQMSSAAHDVSVSAELKLEQEGGIMGLAGSKVTTTLAAGYTYSVEAGVSSATVKESRKKAVVTAKEEIPVPACTFYEVRSWAKVMRDFPVQYETQVEVTGKQGQRQMSAEEVKGMLSDDLEFVENKDGFTVLARGSGEMKTDFGVKSGMNSNSRPIPNCRK